MAPLMPPQAHHAVRNSTVATGRAMRSDGSGAVDLAYQTRPSPLGSQARPQSKAMTRAARNCREDTGKEDRRIGKQDGRQPVALPNRCRPGTLIGIGGHFLEHLGLTAEFTDRREGKRPIELVPGFGLQRHDPVLVPHRQPAQEYRLGHGEDGGPEPDPDREDQMERTAKPGVRARLLTASLRSGKMGAKPNEEVGTRSGR
jgi:hypothetical protein